MSEMSLRALFLTLVTLLATLAASSKDSPNDSPYGHNVDKSNILLEPHEIRDADKIQTVLYYSDKIKRFKGITNVAAHIASDESKRYDIMVCPKAFLLMGSKFWCASEKLDTDVVVIRASLVRLNDDTYGMIESNASPTACINSDRLSITRATGKLTVTCHNESERVNGYLKTEPDHDLEHTGPDAPFTGDEHSSDKRSAATQSTGISGQCCTPEMRQVSGCAKWYETCDVADTADTVINYNSGTNNDEFERITMDRSSEILTKLNYLISLSEVHKVGKAWHFSMFGNSVWASKDGLFMRPKTNLDKYSIDGSKPDDAPIAQTVITCTALSGTQDRSFVNTSFTLDYPSATVEVQTTRKYRSTHETATDIIFATWDTRKKGRRCVNFNFAVFIECAPYQPNHTGGSMTKWCFKE